MPDIGKKSRARKPEPLWFACPICKVLPTDPCVFEGTHNSRPYYTHPERAEYRYARIQPDRHPRLKGGWRKKVYAQLVDRDGESCAECGIASTLQVDHKKALQFGGDNSLRNLWLLCIPCHKAKTSREQSERLKSLFAAHRDMANG